MAVFLLPIRNLSQMHRFHVDGIEIPATGQHFVWFLAIFSLCVHSPILGLPVKNLTPSGYIVPTFLISGEQYFCDWRTFTVNSFILSLRVHRNGSISTSDPKSFPDASLSCRWNWNSGNWSTFRVISSHIFTVRAQPYFGASSEKSDTIWIHRPYFSYIRGTIFRWLEDVYSQFFRQKLKVCHITVSVLFDPLT